MTIIVYETPDCSICKRIKADLKERKITFEERDLSKTPMLADLIVRAKYVFTAPVVEIDGQFFTTFGIEYLEALKKLKGGIR